MGVDSLCGTVVDDRMRYALKPRHWPNVLVRIIFFLFMSLRMMYLGIVFFFFFPLSFPVLQQPMGGVIVQPETFRVLDSAPRPSLGQTNVRRQRLPSPCSYE